MNIVIIPEFTTYAFEQDGQRWANEMLDWLLEARAAVNDAGGALNTTQEGKYKKRYRDILAKAQNECPPPDEKRKKGQRGRIKRSKARNLLERLIQYEEDVLRFMGSEIVPFTNNQGGEGSAHDQGSTKDLRVFPFHGRCADVLPYSWLSFYV